MNRPRVGPNELIADQLNLPCCERKILLRAGITTIGELCMTYRMSLLCIKGCGLRRLKTIECALARVHVDCRGVLMPADALLADPDKKEP